LADGVGQSLIIVLRALREKMNSANFSGEVFSEVRIQHPASLDGLRGS